VQVFIEPLGTEWVLVVFGAGHVAQPLVRLARRVGLRVIVADDRADYANRDRFPDAEQVLVDDLGRLARTIELGPSSYVVIVTRGHEHDREVLAHVIARNPGYIGMIGSRAKVARVFADLRKQGVLDDRLEAVHAPIGLDVGAETPEEIAVSIIAEILCVKNGRPGGFLNPGHSP
jgi:xanthine dehydrogenase accessory factor